MLPERGAFNATFMLARGLVDAGFRVVYIGTSNFRDHIERQGFELWSLDAGADTSSLDGLSPRDEEAARGIRYLASLQRLEAWLAANPIACALLDPIVSPLAPAFLRQKIPVIGVNTTFAAAWNADAPPVFCGLTPLKRGGIVDKIRNLAAWGWLFVRLWRQLGNGLPRRVAVDGQPAQECQPNALIRRAGGQVRWGEYGWRLRVPELVLAPRELDFDRPNSWTPRGYAGTCVCPNRVDMPFDWSRLRSDRRLAYCSLGTFVQCCSGASRFFATIIEAFKQHPDWQIVIHAGDLTARTQIDAAGCSNVVVVELAPQLQILQRASVIITHGGMSSMREAIYFGVPMVIVPFEHDQPGNAARLELRGVGRRADMDRLSPHDLWRLVEEVSSSPTIRASLTQMQRVFREQERCEAGVRYVERYLAAHATGSGR